MNKHTPAPWWVTDNGVRAHGGYIAFTHSVTRYPDQEERYAFEVDQREADKRLIAVAPDLLAAAKSALETAEILISEYLEGTRGFASAWAELQPVRDVIAKAEGEA